VPDVCYDDDYLASLYDLLARHGGPDEAFYLALARSAGRVLDIGCGTGGMLHRLRDSGHRGRLVGLDPAPGMLARARRREDVEWVQGYLPAAGFGAEFDLAYATGHVFQTLLDDAAVGEFLAAARSALAPGGHLAFETRNPHAGAWTQWTADHVADIVDASGRRVRVWRELESADGELVTFVQQFAVEGLPDPLVSRSTLRFTPAEHLDHLLDRAGFRVDERYGDWDRSPFTHHSPEIVTVASPR